MTPERQSIIEELKTLEIPVSISSDEETPNYYLHTEQGNRVAAIAIERIVYNLKTKMFNRAQAMHEVHAMISYLRTIDEGIYDLNAIYAIWAPVNHALRQAGFAEYGFRGY